MAATPIYGKNLLLQNRGCLGTESLHKSSVTEWGVGGGGGGGGSSTKVAKIMVLH